MRTSLSLVAAVLLFAASAALAAQDKVDICHIPPGNPSAAHVITVGSAAVPAHEAHGDQHVTDPCKCSCLGQNEDCLSACDEGDTACKDLCRSAFGSCLSDCEE